ncbi:MAG TPA: ABC transporter ATP-binding protein [Actinomycetota bacterium]|nr:ABC transporter ATP-binding protein [Actinomycetota bacterium]
MTEIAIDVRGLRKSYGTNEAVRGIDLEVARGECFALLGPNGAGKTTTVEILEGHRARTGGEVSVLGFDPGKGSRAFKERIGIVLQETGVERFLTVTETIELFRGFYPHPRPLDEVIEVVGLQEKRDSPVRKLSGGQHRRLDVAIGLAGDPDLLFLDEPTTGFDPGARRSAWKMIENLKSLGKTVFLTTHYMDEAQRLADRVAIIAEGLIVTEGTPETLISRDSATTNISFTVADPTSLPDRLGARAVVNEHRVTLESEAPVDDLFDLTSWAKQAGVEVSDLQVTRRTLEDIYLELTQQKDAGSE